MLRDPALNKQRKGCMEQFWKKNVLELRKKEKKEGQNTIRGVGLDRQQLLRTTENYCTHLFHAPHLSLLERDSGCVITLQCLPCVDSCVTRGDQSRA